MKKYIFGTSLLAEVLSAYIWEDTKEQGSYIVDKEYIEEASHLNNVITWEEFISDISNRDCEVYIAIGYNKMNEIRKDIYNRIKASGYKIGTYIHPSAVISNTSIVGEGSIVMENVTIQPYVKSGICNIFWSNANICHHTEIGNFNFFAASSVVLGKNKIGNNCFIGCNSTIKNELDIADMTLIGAGAYCYKNTKKCDVVVPVRSVFLEKKSLELQI